MGYRVCWIADMKTAAILDFRAAAWKRFWICLTNTECPLFWRITDSLDTALMWSSTERFVRSRNPLRRPYLLQIWVFSRQRPRLEKL
jgi:hypothetical protein